MLLMIKLKMILGPTILGYRLTLLASRINKASNKPSNGANFLRKIVITSFE